MLEVGVTNKHNTNVSTLTYTEARTHFGLWCVLSSPLTLSIDFSDTKTLDSVWDIISNTEAISINQVWAGSPGGLLAESNETVFYLVCDWHPRNCTLPVWQQWWKPLLKSSVAVFVHNNGNLPISTSVQFSMFPSSVLPCAENVSGCNVRDIWRHADLGKHQVALPLTLASHDSAFLILS